MCGARASQAALALAGLLALGLAGLPLKPLLRRLPQRSGH